jgi:hypothetical protein
MFRTLDLRALTVATNELEPSVETFRKAFGFAVRRENRSRVALAIGPADLEMFPAEGEAAGLHSIVLSVDDLADAEKELRARGYAPTRREVAGHAALLLGPDGTHGARIVLVEE